MSNQYEETETIDGILQQIAKARGELSRLTSVGQQDPEITLTALLIEMYLMNKNIFAFREHLLLSLSWADCRTAENQRSVDALLFRISTTLCDIIKQLDEYTHPRPSKSSFRLLPREKLKSKTAELQTSLDRLREQNSVFQCIIGHFEMQTNETTQMLTLCRSMLNVMENDAIKSPGQHRSIGRPPYVANSVTPSKLHNREPLSSYRLTLELQAEGLSMDQISNIYRKLDLKPFMIRDIFRRWRTYGDKEGYQTMLAALVHNGCDIVHVDMQLSRLHELSHSMPPSLWDILRLNKYNLTNTFDGLRRLLILVREEPEWARQHHIKVRRPRELPSIPIGSLELITKAVRAFGGDILETHREFLSLLETAGLTYSMRHNTEYRIGYFLLSPKDILHASNMVLELWQHNGFNKSRASQALSYIPDWKSTTSHILVYLHALRRNSYQNNLKGMLWMTSYSSEISRDILYGDALWIIACCPDPKPADELCADAIWLIERFLPPSRHRVWPRGSIQPYFKLMELYDYSFVRIDNAERTLKEIFPPALVAEGYHWIWFAINDFDLEVTRMDAAALPEEFPKSPAERISVIKEMHRDRGLNNMKYTWFDLAVFFKPESHQNHYLVSSPEF